MPEPTTNRTQTATTLGLHQRVSIGMTHGSPDQCACGARTLPAPGEEDVSDRRNRAFAEHQAAVLIPATTVTATVKPCQVVGTATAKVQATDATYDQVLDAGLAALHETRASLFGYGIKQLPRREAPELLTGTFTVYADRD